MGLNTPKTRVGVGVETASVRSKEVLMIRSMLLMLILATACVEPVDAEDQSVDVVDEGSDMETEPEVEVLPLCYDAPVFDFSENPEDTEAFFEGHGYVHPCSFPEHRASHPLLEETKIPLQFNILYYPKVELETIKDGIRRDLEALNIVFEPLNVEFYPSGVTAVYDRDFDVTDYTEDTENPDIRSDLAIVDDYEERFPESEGFTIYYLPQISYVDGHESYSHIAMFYTTPDLVLGHVRGRVIGYGFSKVNLGHEMGHAAGLDHVFHDRYESLGDGLGDTVDYFEVCGTDDEGSNYFETIDTYVDNGVCWVSCAPDCSFKAPANIMHYIHCTEGDALAVFSEEQLGIMNCELQEETGGMGGGLRPYLGLVLPEVEL